MPPVIRIIVRTQSVGEAIHVQNAVATQDYRTFDIQAPELEAFLKNTLAYVSRDVIGAEVVEGS